VIRTPELSRPPHEGLKLTPESTKPAQEKESVKATLESDKLTEDATPFNLLEAFFASFNLDPRTGKPRYPIRTPWTVR
jgi:hypothetical protein